MQWRKEWVIPSGVGILSFTLGAVIGYAYSQRKGTREVITVVNNTTKVVDEEPTEEVEETIHVRHESEAVVERVVELTPDQREQVAIEEALADERTALELERIREVQARGDNQFNVFDSDADTWDYDVEIPLRTPNAPYIIHRDEFLSQEAENNSQSNLTYYAGDDVLCDEQDQPVYDYKRIVGTLEFGKGSEDISICYVRNEKLEAEWEIIIDHGYYQTEVLGEEIEHSYEQRDLKHSLHKFREDE